MKNANWLVMGVVLLALAACGGKKAVTPSSTTSAVPSTSSSSDTSALTTPATASTEGSDAGAASSRNGAVADRTIYFDFDSSEVRPQYNDLIKTHATALSRNASIRVRLEGHTDERGSREYNIGLGERRAQAVRRALLLQGVTEAQVSTVSYGEERPAQEGSSEAAWAKNRRVEIVYLN